MSIALGMIVFGAILIYGGFTNRSVWALARGDNTVSKPAELSASAAGNPTGIQGPVTG